MRTILTITSPIVILVGCASPSVVMVNDEAKFVHCAASGANQAAIVAQNMVTACVNDYRKMGFIPIPDVSWGLRLSEWRASPARVTEVESGSPADLSDIKVGDLVVSVDGRSITKGWDVIQAISAKQPGDSIRVQIEREGVRIDKESRLRASR